MSIAEWRAIIKYAQIEQDQKQSINTLKEQDINRLEDLMNKWR